MYSQQLVALKIINIIDLLFNNNFSIKHFVLFKLAASSQMVNTAPPIATAYYYPTAAPDTFDITALTAAVTAAGTFAFSTAAVADTLK